MQSIVYATFHGFMNDSDTCWVHHTSEQMVHEGDGSKAVAPPSRMQRHIQHGTRYATYCFLPNQRTQTPTPSIACTELYVMGVQQPHSRPLVTWHNRVLFTRHTTSCFIPFKIISQSTPKGDCDFQTPTLLVLHLTAAFSNPESRHIAIRSCLWHVL